MKQEDASYIQPEQSPVVSASTVKPGEVILGTIADLDDQGQVLVDFHGNTQGRLLEAVSTVSISHRHKGRQVAILFANGEPDKPVIIGLVHSPLQEMLETFEVTPMNGSAPAPEAQQDSKLEDVTVDGKRIVFEGKDEIVLKCGEASITLTRAGKILIRGKYLLNRSTGVNRIMGGSVQVN